MTDPATALVERVTALRLHAAHLLSLPLPPFRVAFDLQGLAAGRCVIRPARGGPGVLIRFNARLLSDPALFRHALAEVAPHEVAHGAVACLGPHGGRPPRAHGPEWRALCGLLGGSGETTHRLPLPRARRQRQFEYRLPGGELVWLGAVRHRRLQEGRAQYWLRRQPIRARAHTGRARSVPPGPFAALPAPPNGFAPPGRLR